MSSLIAIVRSLPFFQHLIVCSTLYPKMILSEMRCPGMKAHCLGEIIVERIFYNLLAITFDINL